MNMTAMSIRVAQGMGHPFPEQVESVMQDTWGHLAPVARQVYGGFILFTHGIHGDITVIDWEFATREGLELDGSPWLYTDMHEQVGQWIEDKKNFRGGIWKFEGTFERLKNGKSRWRGKVKPQRVQNRFNGRR